MISFLYIKKIFTGVLMVTIFIPYSMHAQSSEFPIIDENGFLIEEISEEEALKAEQELELLRNQPEVDPQNVKQGELISCSDYYSLGSLHINLIQNYTAYDAGDLIILKGTLKNTNSYPLIGVDIKARLVKNISETTSVKSETIILEDVDIAQDLTIKAGEDYSISYSHLLPLNTPSGEYSMYFYATEQDSYNISGLSFTNDIVGSKISFTVKGTQPDHIYLDQTQIIVGDQDYDVMGSMTQHVSDSAIPVSIPIYNPSEQSKRMTITYRLYSWDSARSQNSITTKTEQVTVAPRSEQLLTYTVTEPVYPVYYLSIEATPTDNTKDPSVFRETTSSHVRFVVQDISKPRLHFSTVSAHPLIKGEEASIVTCFHNMGEGEKPYAKIETMLKDMNGKILAQSLYEGLVPSDITAVRQVFDAKSTISEFILSTIMYDKEGNIIDQVDKVYTQCNGSETESCKTQKTFPWMKLIFTIGGLCLVIGLLLMRKKLIMIERV